MADRVHSNINPIHPCLLLNSPLLVLHVDLMHEKVYQIYISKASAYHLMTSIPKNAFSFIISCYKKYQAPFILISYVVSLGQVMPRTQLKGEETEARYRPYQRIGLLPLKFSVDKSKQTYKVIPFRPASSVGFAPKKGNQ
jgi:hypothetical protein